MPSPDSHASSGSRDSHPPSAVPGKKRPRLKKKAVWLGLLLLLALGLHRPLLHAATRQILLRAAGRAGLNLNLHVSGSVWTGICFSKIKLTPAAAQNLVLGSLDCAQLELKYSLLRMLWSSPAEAVRSYRMHGVNLRLHSLRPSPQKTAGDAAPGDWMRTVEKVLALPALYADAVELRDVSIQIEDGFPFQSVHGFEFGAFGDRPGRAGFVSLTFRPAPDGDDTPPVVGPVWAATEYTRRSLVITDLAITPRLRLARFAFDASERGRGRSRVEVHLAADEGRLRAALLEQKEGFALGEKTRTSSRWRLEIDGKTFPLQTCLEQLGFRPGRLPDIEWVESHMDGDPHEPGTWKGQADLRTHHVLPSGAALAAELHATLHGGTVSLARSQAVSEHTRAEFSGTLRLPPAWRRWQELEASLHGKAHVRNLQEWRIAQDSAADTPRGPGGSCSAEGSVTIRGGSLATELHAGAAGLMLSGGSLGGARASLEAWIPLESLRDVATARKTLSARTAMELEHGQIQRAGIALAFERASLAGVASEGAFEIQSAGVESGPNRARFRGVWVPNTGAHGAARFRNVECEVSCPSLEKSGLRFRGHALGGSLSAGARGNLDSDAWEGNLELRGQHLRWGDWEIPVLAGKATAGEGRLILEPFRAQLKPDGYVSISGELDLRGDRPFKAAARIQIPKLSALAAALAQAGWQGPYSGSVDATWGGYGKQLPGEASGEWSVDGRELDWKSLKIKRFQCTGTHQPGRIETTKVEIATGETVVHAPMLWNSQGLDLPQIRIEQGGKEVLHGTFRLPVTLRGGSLGWLPDATLVGHLRAQKFNLGTLWKNTPARPPVSGLVDLQLTLEGTPDSPEIAFRGEGVGLQFQASPEFPRCNLRLAATHHADFLHGELTLDSALGGPAQFRFRVPVALSQLIQKDAWPSVTFDAHVDWPRMKLGALPAVWTALKQVEGEATLRGDIRGPWNALRWSGDLKMDCATVHFRNDRIPALTDLRLAVHGGEGGLRIQTFRADLGGGSLEMRGNAKGANLRNPTLDLQVSANQVLVQRNPQLSLRLDGNLRIAGPLQSAAVTGRVTPVKSMVRREVEVLPLTALTHASGGYKRPPGKPWFTFPREPLANWRFDVGIVSRPEDPILIRGNRLRGTAMSDIRFQGTGKTPTLSGSFQTDNLVASLPFARMEVSRGRLWYHASDPFSAQVDLSAETEVRSHRIRLYLFGSPESPAVSVSSDPPLPEADALALLTTGVLPGAVGSESAQGVAARAASLLLQEFSSKFLEPSTGNREGFAALRRFNLEMGAINNRTGTQETRLSYRIQDNVFMIGEVGANGDFATRLRYILRFR